MKKSMPMISKLDIMGNIYEGNFYVTVCAVRSSCIRSRNRIK